MNEKLRTVVVDDSSIYREIVISVLKDIPDVELVGTANNGLVALEVIAKLKPDLVLLDLEMPVMDGLASLARIVVDFPDVSVLMVSSVSDAQRTMRALSLGAIDFIVKPANHGRDELLRSLSRVIPVVRSRSRLGERGPSIPPTPIEASHVTASTVPSSTRDESVSRAGMSRPATLNMARNGIVLDVAQDVSRLIVIGVSTGGPKALESVIPHLPTELSCPILIVQHMPAGFTQPLAQSLNARSVLDVAEGKTGDQVEPGRVLIAPGGSQMTLRHNPLHGGAWVLKIDDGPARNHCRPSVDVLLESVAAQFTGKVLVAILTGMGRDGCDGVGSLKARGAYCLAQDEATSVVYGMSRAVVEAGYADEVLPLAGFATRMQAWALGAMGRMSK